MFRVFSSPSRSVSVTPFGRLWCCLMFLVYRIMQKPQKDAAKARGARLEREAEAKPLFSSQCNASSHFTHENLLPCALDGTMRIAIELTSVDEGKQRKGAAAALGVIYFVMTAPKGRAKKDDTVERSSASKRKSSSKRAFEGVDLKGTFSSSVWPSIRKCAPNSNRDVPAVKLLTVWRASIIVVAINCIVNTLQVIRSFYTISL